MRSQALNSLDLSCSRPIRSRICGAILLLIATLGGTQSVQGQLRFSDTFELKRFWSVFEQYGSVGLSSDVSRSGTMSLKLSSESGGQRYIWVEHTFATPWRGTLSVWFYDTAPGSETLYVGLFANYSDPNGGFAVNVADWNSSHYVWGGPGVGESPTSVPRTIGWHEFKLRVATEGFDAFIDGILVGSIPGNFDFRDVRLQLSGPIWRPNATFYFDDFTFAPTKGARAIQD